jgi:predicted metal-dependent hydrolase
MDEWYREHVRAAVAPLVWKWEAQLCVQVLGISVRRMKTKWGSCSPVARTIRLNTELAKKPAECLEYVLVHELLHLIEPTHNRRFVALMNEHMPKWKSHREELNRLPVRHESWKY